MKNLKVLAATLTLLVGASGAALAQPKQHDRRSDDRPTANSAYVFNHADHDGISRASEMSYAPPRADRDDWNRSFVNARTRQDDVRGRDDDAGSQYRAAESRRGDERFQQTREVRTRNVHPVRPGTADRDRF